MADPQGWPPLGLRSPARRCRTTQVDIDEAGPYNLPADGNGEYTQTSEPRMRWKDVNNSRSACICSNAAKFSATSARSGTELKQGGHQSPRTGRGREKSPARGRRAAGPHRCPPYSCAFPVLRNCPPGTSWSWWEAAGVTCCATCHRRTSDVGRPTIAGSPTRVRAPVTPRRTSVCERWWPSVHPSCTRSIFGARCRREDDARRIDTPLYPTQATCID